MPRYHNINGNNVQFTAAEETARDNEEAAWANAAPARALADLRDKRNRLLQSSDWEIMQELEKGNAISDEHENISTGIERFTERKRYSC